MIVSMKSGLVLTLLLVLAAAVKAQEKHTAEDILQRHLDSIGTAAIRSAAKSRVAEATASSRILLGANPAHYDGKAVIVSEGNKLQMPLKINAPQYTGERFKRYGDRTSIEATNVNQTRSELGTRLESDDIPIREGLIGGVLTTGWPLFDVGAHKGKSPVHRHRSAAFKKKSREAERSRREECTPGTNVVDNRRAIREFQDRGRHDPARTLQFVFSAAIPERIYEYNRVGCDCHAGAQ